MSDSIQLEQLIYASALGNQQAFAALYERTASRMMAVAFAILKDRGMAEEALQEAFVQVWYAIKDYRSDLGKPTTWLTAIVRNRALDLYRKESRSPLGIRNREDNTDIPDCSAHSNFSADLKALLDCMEPLPQEQRRSILMSYYWGYSHGEVASRMRLPLGTIKTWIRRGISKVRECLGP